MPRYRCYACVNEKGTPGRDFDAAGSPVCPKCGADPKKDARHARVIARLETVHFDAPSGVAGIGVGHPACNPAVKLPGGDNVRATGDPNAVTCDKCRATPAWAEALPGFDPDAIPPEFAGLEVETPA